MRVGAAGLAFPPAIRALSPDGADLVAVAFLRALRRTIIAR